MSDPIRSEQLSEVVMKALKDYEGLTMETLRKAVQHAGKTAKEEIQNTAPKDTGAYAKSWRVKRPVETGNSVQTTVHSPSGYRIAHLLEHGHAKRGGGRVRAYPHIAPAEEKAEAGLIEELERRLP